MKDEVSIFGTSFLKFIDFDAHRISALTASLSWNKFMLPTSAEVRLAMDNANVKEAVDIQYSSPTETVRTLALFVMRVACLTIFLS